MTCLILMKAFSLFFPIKFRKSRLKLQNYRPTTVLIPVSESCSRPIPLHQPARLTARSCEHLTVSLRHRLVMKREKLIIETEVSLFIQSVQKLLCAKR
jgi:hypothetical protein